MFVWQQREVVLAPGGVHHWFSSNSWQRGWGDAIGDANAPIYAATPRSEGPLSNGDRVIVLEQVTVDVAGETAAPRVLTQVVLPVAGLDGPTWQIFEAFGFTSSVYGALTATLDQNRAVDVIYQRAADPFSPLDGGVTLLADLPLERLLDTDAAVRSTYFATAYTLREGDGTVSVSLQVFDPVTAAPLGPLQTVATLSDADAAWNVEDWNSSQVVLLSETAAHDLRLQTFRNDGAPNSANRDYVIPLEAEDVFSVRYDFTNRVPGADVLLALSDQVGGGAGVRVLYGDDNGSVVASGTFTIVQQARFATAGGAPLFNFREINHTQTDARFGDLLFYYLDGGDAFARIYDVQSNSFEAPLLIAAGVTRAEFGSIIDYEDGRFLLTYTDVAADGLTSASLGRIIDVRTASAVSNFNQTIVGSALADTLTNAILDARIFAGAGDDRIALSPGRMQVNGGDGIDTVALSRTASEFTLRAFGGEVAALRQGALDDTLSGGAAYRMEEVEQFEFTDVTLTSAPVFDALSYVASHGDLGAAFGANAQAGWDHYVANGFFEERGVTFDALRYIASHGDLIAALGADAEAGARHFILDGRAEGRGVSFDALNYVASNPDLIAAFGADAGAALRHFIGFGFGEGRAVTFDPLRYLASHADLLAAFGADAEAAARHFIGFGFGEGRAITFDALRYLASHADLVAAFGVNADAATRHFVSFGAFEGRGVTFDALDYIASHPDLIAAFGVNPEAGLTHWLNNGLAEGRVADGFDGAQYLANYADLQSAFGTDEEAAARHFIAFGFAEGRVDDLL